VTAFRLPAILTLLAALPGLASAQKRTGAELGRQIIAAGLDPAECYRVRDLEITHDEARIYLSDGYLMFGKPVDGVPLTAVFPAIPTVETPKCCCCLRTVRNVGRWRPTRARRI
jgi:hypothetical protein